VCSSTIEEIVVGLQAELVTGGKNGSLVSLDASGKVISTIDKAHR